MNTKMAYQEPEQPVFYSLRSTPKAHMDTDNFTTHA